MTFQYSDSGAGASGLNEKNDCTVKATAAVLRIPYAEARAKLAALGRKPGCGFTFREPMVKALGLEIAPEYSCKRLATVLRELPTSGAFVIRVGHHVDAFVDGTFIYSHEKPLGTIVRMVYQVTA